jgi:hypothetical protein
MHCSPRRRFQRTSSPVLMVLLSPFAGNVVLAQELVTLVTDRRGARAESRTCSHEEITR